jgi:hypothetical protein
MLPALLTWATQNRPDAEPQTPATEEMTIADATDPAQAA